MNGRWRYITRHRIIVNAIKDLTEKTDNRLLDIANQINNLDKSYLTVDIANSMKDIADSLKKIEGNKWLE